MQKMLKRLLFFWPAKFRLYSLRGECVMSRRRWNSCRCWLLEKFQYLNLNLLMLFSNSLLVRTFKLIFIVEVELAINVWRVTLEKCVLFVKLKWGINYTLELVQLNVQNVFHWLFNSYNYLECFYFSYFMFLTSSSKFVTFLLF